MRSSTETCFPRRDDRPRRSRPRPRGRPEASFDFYDDWEQDETDALLAWENDEFDGLLSPDEDNEPGRRGIMNYGTRNDARTQRTRPRRLGMPYDEDPTYIPKTSYFGFLERFKLGSRGLRYRPSAADLKVRPKEAAKADSESSGQEESANPKSKHGRQRSLTNGSERSGNSLSSRGDLFPSDEEDDAVPIDDELALVLERHASASAQDDSSSTKTGSSKRRSTSGKLKRTASLKTAKSSSQHESPVSIRSPQDQLDGNSNAPSMHDLNDEEIQVKVKEEQEIKVKRQAAQKLAEERGLTVSDTPTTVDHEEINDSYPGGNGDVHNDNDFAGQQRPP